MRRDLRGEPVAVTGPEAEESRASGEEGGARESERAMESSRRCRLKTSPRESYGLATAAIGNLPVAARRLLASNEPRAGSGDMLEGDFRRVLRASVGREPTQQKEEAADSTGSSGEISGLCESGRQDLNLRPLGPERQVKPAHLLHPATRRRKPLIRLHLWWGGIARGHSQCVGAAGVDCERTAELARQDRRAGLRVGCGIFGRRPFSGPARALRTGAGRPADSPGRYAATPRGAALTSRRADAVDCI
jgi:hypothetical protein